jgi:hypothetical protein
MTDDDQHQSKRTPLCEKQQDVDQGDAADDDIDIEDGISTTSSKRSSRSFFRYGLSSFFPGEPKRKRKKTSSSKKKNDTDKSATQELKGDPTLCCKCCDMRIATVLLDLVHVVFSVLLEILYNAGDIVDEPPMMCFLALIFSGLGVFGGLNFNVTAMYFSTLGLVLLFFLYLREIHVFGLVLVCGCLFSHSILIYELRTGILTKENYGSREYINDTGRRAMETAHSYASDAAETTKEFVTTTSDAINGVLAGNEPRMTLEEQSDEGNDNAGAGRQQRPKVREEC